MRSRFDSKNDLSYYFIMYARMKQLCKHNSNNPVIFCFYYNFDIDVTFWNCSYLKLTLLMA